MFDPAEPTFDLGPDLRPGYTGEPDHAVLAEVLRLIGRDGTPGWALEFGVATGKTLDLIARRLPVIGFDSFEGLPETWRPGYERGMFAGIRPIEDIQNATIVEGWFENTMPGYEWPESVALIHIDCDLYSSTAFVLNELAPVIDVGTYIVFDEFFGYDGADAHEQRAWFEFIDATGLEYDVIGHGREQLAVKIK